MNIFVNSLISTLQKKDIYTLLVKGQGFRSLQTNVDFAKEYKKYRSEKDLDWKINIRDYCEKHNISPGAMISWVKENNPSNK